MTNGEKRMTPWRHDRRMNDSAKVSRETMSPERGVEWGMRNDEGGWYLVTRCHRKVPNVFSRIPESPSDPAREGHAVRADKSREENHREGDNAY
jgi:hypothetical protein